MKKAKKYLCGKCRDTGFIKVEHGSEFCTCDIGIEEKITAEMGEIE